MEMNSLSYFFNKTRVDKVCQLPGILIGSQLESSKPFRNAGAK